MVITAALLIAVRAEAAGTAYGVDTAEVSEAVSAGEGGGLMHGPTFMANPLACAVALASMRLLDDGAWRGQVGAIESGYYQRCIQEESYKFEKQVESGERVVVGVNKYRDQDEEPTPFFKADNPTLEKAQVAKLEALKQHRDAGAVAISLDGPGS